MAQFCIDQTMLGVFCSINNLQAIDVSGAADSSSSSAYKTARHSWL